MIFDCVEMTGGVCITPTGGISPCCCTSKNTASITNVSNINAAIKNDNLKRMIAQSNLGIPPLECNSCVEREQANFISRRIKYRTMFDGVVGDIFNDKIVHMDISLSNLCNQKCIMCNSAFSSRWVATDTKFLGDSRYVYRNPNRNQQSLIPGNWSLSYDQIDQIISLITEHTKFIEFKGGEPFYDKKLEYFIRAAIQKNKNIKFSVTTNGTVANPDILAYINSLNNITIAISLDDINDNYTKIRDYEFSKFVESFEFWVEHLSPSHRLHVNPTILKYNVDRMQILYEWIGTVAHKFNRRININFSQIVSSPQSLIAFMAGEEKLLNGIEQLHYIRTDPMQFASWSQYTSNIDYLIAFLENQVLFAKEFPVGKFHENIIKEDFLLKARDGLA